MKDRPPLDRGRFVIAAFLALAGLVSLSVAGAHYLRDRAFALRAVRTEAVVVALSNQWSRDGNSVSAVLDFEAGGWPVRVSSRISTDPPAYVVGQRVPIVYDPANPEGAVIDSWKERYLVPIVGAGLGLLFLAVAAGYFFSSAGPSAMSDLN